MHADHLALCSFTLPVIGNRGAALRRALLAWLPCAPVLSAMQQRIALLVSSPDKFMSFRHLLMKQQTDVVRRQTLPVLVKEAEERYRRILGVFAREY